MEESGNNIWLWLLGLIAIGSTVGKGATTVVNTVTSKISMLFEKVTFEITGVNVDMRFFFKIKNDNSIGGQINSFTGIAFLQGKELGEVSIDDSFDIAPNATTDTISFIVNYSLFTAGGIIIDGIKNGNTDSNVRVIGKLETSYGTFNIDKSTPLVNV